MSILLGIGATLTAAAGLYFLLATMGRRHRRATARARLYRTAKVELWDEPTGRAYPGGAKWERGF